MTLPNFLIIGAAKSGTTSLYHYLKQHPQLFVSERKESNYFTFSHNKAPDFNWWGHKPASLFLPVASLEEYQSQFADNQAKVAIGEASPMYLYSPYAASRIKSTLPNAKLIVIFRHPVDRAFSHYAHLRRDGREPIVDFYKAIQAESQRRQENWVWDYFYTDMSMYYEQLKRFTSLFPPSQIKIVLFDDLLANGNETMSSIANFLEVDSDFTFDTEIRHNISGIPRNAPLHTFLTSPNLLKEVSRYLLPRKIRQRFASFLWHKNLDSLTLPADARQKLMPFFYEDLLKLQPLIQRDLTDWLTID